MGAPRKRNAEPHVPVTFTMPASLGAMLRAESLELYGTEDKYANLIRSDIRAGLASRGKLPREASPRSAQRAMAWFVAPPIGMVVASGGCVRDSGDIAGLVGLMLCGFAMLIAWCFAGKRGGR